MASGTFDSPQAAELSRILHAINPPACPSGFVPSLVSALLASVDSQRALWHLLRYLECLGDASAFWATCREQPEFLRGMAVAFAGSHFLSGILWRDPQLAFWLRDEALYAPPPSAATLAKQLDAALEGRTDEAQVAAALSRFTQRHLLRIGARDLNRLAAVDETTDGLATLAGCVLQAAVRACQGWLTALHGEPVYTDDSGAERPCHFCVIGLGKLGGGELNFSSDIDVMYVYTSYQGQTRGVLRNGERCGRISNHEYFVALARRLTVLIGGQHGVAGKIFRVDLRLRPDGTQGQLALALLAYEAYYARLGQPWEKMALIKAHPVAGDADLGREFMTMIRPFVYQRHVDAQGVEQLRSMKRQIDAQMADKNESRTNVKLGRGGIREVEFLIQLLQLLFGGRRPELQERNSLRALGKLHDVGLLESEPEALLRDTYCYLRRVEHLLQMEQGAQTHTLPRNEEARQRMARYFGHDDWKAFYQDYLARTEAVHALFAAAFRME
jgi:glutamate-ammonia-ligase adenylyltransferase